MKKNTKKTKAEKAEDEHMKEEMEDQNPEVALEESNGEDEMAAEEVDVDVVDSSANSNSDAEEQDDSDEDEENDEGKEEDEGFSESDLKPSTANKRVVFDDDETFEDIPPPVSLVGKESPSDVEEGSDSDGPPEEESISGRKDVSVEDSVKMKTEISNLKKQVREARRLRHEKNRDQQVKKRARIHKLEKSRLPESLLEAVVKEEEEVKTVCPVKPMGKRKTFNKDSLSDEELISEQVDDDELITLERGVKVRPVQRELKKHQTIANIASDFRQRALHSKKNVRTTSLIQRNMLVKQKKGGRNMLVS